MIPGFGAGLVIETRSLPNLLVATLATLPSMSLIPSAPLKLVRCPRSLAPTLVVLRSMSLIPSAPFPICRNRRPCARCNREKILLRRGYGGTSVVVQAPTALKSAVTEPCYTGFASRRRASKSKGRVSITIEPSGLCGHSSFGRSR